MIYDLRLISSGDSSRPSSRGSVCSWSPVVSGFSASRVLVVRASELGEGQRKVVECIEACYDCYTFASLLHYRRV